MNTFLISSQQLRSKLGEDVHIPCPTSTTKGEKIIILFYLHMPLKEKIVFSFSERAMNEKVKKTCRKCKVMFNIEGGAVITWSWNGRLVSAGAMKVVNNEYKQRININVAGLH